MEWHGTVWADLFMAAMEASGITDIMGACEDSDETLWVATDTGLAECRYEVDEGNPIRMQVTVCPWVDVKNPELTTDVIAAAGQPHVTIHLRVQLPRLDVTQAGRPRIEAFAGFVREVFLRAGP